ncbi:MAG: carbonic anhydrase, partial [Bdellovibrio sp.]
PVPADKAWGWLRNGNTRFTKGRFRNDGASSQDRRRLAGGQRPHSVILSCSDSRVPPEVLFDQKLGEIFVVRTAGQSLDNNVIGSIEYAVEHLGANLIVVLGHESCGAVRASLSSLQGASMGSPALEGLVKDIKPRVRQYASTQPSQGLLQESWSNVEGVSKDLIERSALLRDATASGELKIVRALYHLESGQVEWR